VKTSGIGRPGVIDPSRFSSPLASVEIAGYCGAEVRFVIDTFGAKRCMLASNFPWDGHLCDYSTLWNVYKRIVTDATSDEKAELFHDTAVRFFGIGG